MQLTASYGLILALVPATTIIVVGWLCGAVPDKTAVGKLLTLIAEPNLKDLLKHNGFPGVSMPVFQLVRLGVTAVIALLIRYILGLTGKAGAVSFLIVMILSYKFLYLLLIYKDNQRIARLNRILPYTIKSIAYLANVFPVPNALIRSITLAPKEFRQDLEQLCQDIDEDPVSFAPYQVFIDRYDGKLSRLEYYLKTLYRMSQSASEEEIKLLANLNETISDEMSNARKAKNHMVNSTVAYLGMIPVALLTIMLLFLMITVTSAL